MWVFDIALITMTDQKEHPRPHHTVAAIMQKQQGLR